MNKYSSMLNFQNGSLFFRGESFNIRLLPRADFQLFSELFDFSFGFLRPRAGKFDVRMCLVGLIRLSINIRRWGFFEYRQTSCVISHVITLYHWIFANLSRRKVQVALLIHFQLGFIQLKWRSIDVTHSRLCDFFLIY